MKNKTLFAGILIALIFSLGINLPSLPKDRFDFKESSDGYSNFQYSVLVFDSWTGQIEYVAEGKFSNGPEGKGTFQTVGRVLRYGEEPIWIFAERYILILIQIALVIFSWFILIKDNS